MKKITSTLFTSFAEYTGNVSKADRLCDDIFSFKKGAKIVMLINDTKDNIYQNGTVGTVTGITFEKDNVRIKSISVEFPKGTAEIEKHDFQKTEYVAEAEEIIQTDTDGKEIQRKRKVKELRQKLIGTATQFPMRLGYAVTIHKSQGQTYDAMNLIPEIFAAGQLYVALSRCKTVDSIYIYGELKKYMVKTSKEVIDFYSDPENYTFFDKDEAVKPMFIPLKYIKEVEQFLAELSQKESSENNEKGSLFAKFKKATCTTKNNN